MPSAALPVLLNVTGLIALVVPTFCDAKLNLLTFTDGAAGIVAATASAAPNIFSFPRPQFSLGVDPVLESEIALS
jgi:hypothetical protein